MLAFIETFERRLRAAVDGAAALLIAAVTVLGVAQVFWRYVLNSSLVWSEELIRLLFVWLIFVGAASTAHLRIDLLTDRSGPVVARTLAALRDVLAIGLLLVVVMGALRLWATFGSDSYVALDLTKSWYWSSAIAGCLLWSALLLLRCVLIVSGRRKTE